MVDGDQLNVIVDPLFVTIAERNVKEFDVIPLFYDASKAPPELLSRAALFEGLKRAHDYSSGGITSIGEISNMLTRLWNKDNPDRVAAAWLTMFNNLVIDAAKSGILSHYDNYPSVAKRINKAIGGKNGRLPYWFKFSKNGRKDPPPGKKKREYLQPNQSVMNRICASFDDIGNIDLKLAEVPPFNWQMLLSEPCDDNPEIGELFCDWDNTNITSVIEASDYDYASEAEAIANYEMLAETIKEDMIERYGSLEETYPYVAKYLFTGRNVDKTSHKQMFWRVYGDIALEILKQNLDNCDVCPECGMKFPSWEKHHLCARTRGFFECVQCGQVSLRTNARQCRCATCQESYRHERETARSSLRWQQRMEEKKRRIGILQSSLRRT